MIDRNDHLDAGAAALYALGSLDEVQRRAIDRHLPGCAACSGLIGVAEGQVAVAASAEPAHELPAWFAVTRTPTRRPPVRATAWSAWAAVAAVMLAAILPSAYLWQENRTMHASMQTDADAMNRLTTAAFRTADFRGLQGTSSARVMYAPDGSWYVVLVRGASRALHVVWMHDGVKTPLGAAQPHGDVAMLYLSKSHRMDQLALVDGDRVVAEAQLAY